MIAVRAVSLTVAKKYAVGESLPTFQRKLKSDFIEASILTSVLIVAEVLPARMSFGSLTQLAALFFAPPEN